MGGYAAQIGQNANGLIAVIHYELCRLPRIVRHTHRIDADILYLKRYIAIERLRALFSADTAGFEGSGA